MSHFIGTMLGLGVEEKDEVLAEQLLKCIGADPDGEEMYEEIGSLDGDYNPDIEGPLDDYDLLGISSSIQEKFTEYMNRFDDYYPDFEDDDEEDEYDDEEEEDTIQGEADKDSRLDDLCLLVKQVFGEARVYLAHEEGNSVNDSYYRYEAILDPSAGKKSVVNCYYSFDGGPDKEDGTEWSEYPINAHKYDSKVIDNLIKKAESLQFDELAEKLRVYINGPDKLETGVPAEEPVKEILQRRIGNDWYQGTEEELAKIEKKLRKKYEKDREDRYEDAEYSIDEYFRRKWTSPYTEDFARANMDLDEEVIIPGHRFIVSTNTITYRMKGNRQYLYWLYKDITELGGIQGDEYYGSGMAIDPSADYLVINPSEDNIKNSDIVKDAIKKKAEGHPIKIVGEPQLYRAIKKALSGK